MNIFLHMIEMEFSSENVVPPIHHIPEIVRYDHEKNTSEGSEFLDDAIRMADLFPDSLD